MWTDERINQIAADAASGSLTVEGVAALMAAYIREMRDEFTRHIADLNAALDNALMEATALDTLNRECRKDNDRLRQSVNQQHAELVGWRQRDLVKVI